MYSYKKYRNKAVINRDGSLHVQLDVLPKHFAGG
jgi:hypothetical protein